MVIDSSGNLNINGTVTESTTPTFDTNDFKIENRTGGAIAVLQNPEGNLLLKDTLQESQSDLSPTLNSFIIENITGQVLLTRENLRFSVSWK